MKKILTGLFFLFFSMISVQKYNNGDPFTYIKSMISEIKTREEFVNLVQGDENITAVIAYNNNFYGNDYDIFLEMAKIYNEISFIFYQNKKIKFYRMNMLKGISGNIVTRKHSGISFFYKNECIGKIDEGETKEKIKNYIIALIEKTLP
jgi:hypothetical protein